MERRVGRERVAACEAQFYFLWGTSSRRLHHEASIGVGRLGAGNACVAGCFDGAAQIVVDGTRDAGYGAALAVQTVQTGFGDANPDGGSELDGGYLRIDAGKLYVMLTGNLEANFNKLEIFIDSKAGGQSVFDSSGNDGAGVMDGLVFDAGFTADYHIIVRRGNDAGNDKLDIDFANLLAQSRQRILGRHWRLDGKRFDGHGRERRGD